MQPVYYSRGKLAVLAILSAVVGGLTILPFFDRSLEFSGAAGVLFSGSIGHLIVAPIFALGSVLVGWRVALVAAGSREALSVDHDGLHVTTLWAHRDIAWSDLLLARMIERRTRYGKRYYLCFDRRSGSSVRLSIALTTLGVDRYRDLVMALGERQYQEAHGRAGIPLPVAPVKDGLAIAPSARAFGRKGALG